MSLNDLMARQSNDALRASGETAHTGTLRIDSRKLGHLFTLLLCGVVAGVVVAAAAFPAIGLTGLTAKATSDSFQNLPADLRDPLIPQTSAIYDSKGNHITSFYDENRTYLKLAEVPQVMQDAMVAAEDQRFYEHRGVDPAGIIRAVVANKQAGEVTQGASTLTQQYVKNILQYAAKTEEERDEATAATTARKIQEVRYAVAVEKKLSKEEILERYLNIAFFGNRGHGIYAASKAYFSKQPTELTLGEAALLAGFVKAPSFYDPTKHAGKKAKERRNYVLDRMVKQDFISEKEAKEAKKEEIALNPSEEPRKCENAASPEYYGFYCAYFVEWWQENPAFGKTRAARMLNLERGGYRITTALNTDVQDAAQRSVDSKISRNDPMMVGIVVIEPGSGRVLAMANNRTFSIEDNGGNRKYPNTSIPLLSGTDTSEGYQAGSTFKMFAAVAALEKGLPLSFKRHSPAKYKTRFKVADYDQSGAGTCGGGYYCPNNYSGAPVGAQDMWSGFGQSINTYFVQLAEQTGVKAAVDAAERMGIRFRPNEAEKFKKNPEGYPSFVLGTLQTTPLDLASAYATLAARGKYCKPLPLQSITTPDGKPLPYANPECRQAIAPDVADAATDMARCPVGQKGHGSCGSNVTAASVGRKITRPIAGKTGTTDADMAAWFVGFTPNLAAAAVKVNPDSPNQTVRGTNQPIEVFEETMSDVLQWYPEADFVPPTEGRINGQQETVPVVAGSDPKQAQQMIENSSFKARIEPDKVASNQPNGRVSHTNPNGGDPAPRGSTVNIYVSSGAAAPPASPAPNQQPSEAPPNPDPQPAAREPDTPDTNEASR